MELIETLRRMFAEPVYRTRSGGSAPTGNRYESVSDRLPVSWHASLSR